MTIQSFTKTSWWRRKLLEPVLAQLKQGITPEKLALTIALAAMLGIFPVLGTTTILCLAVAFLLKLNQPVMQIANHLCYPLQLLLILPFIRMGEWLFHAPPMSLSIPGMLEKFHAGPLHFFHEFGMVFVYCISAWLLIAPLGTAALYFSLRPALQSAAQRVQKGKP